MTTYATKKIDVSLHSLSFIATAIAQMIRCTDLYMNEEEHDHI